MKSSELNKLINDLKEKQYFEIPTTITKEEIDGAIISFFKFLELPASVKEKFHAKMTENDRGSNIGYDIKDLNKGDSDSKEIFHYNENVKILFQELIDNEVLEFLDRTDIIYKKCKEEMSSILRVLDQKYSGTYEKFFPKNKTPKCYLRFLKYNPINRDVIAKPHYDRGDCTLAVAQSNAGLRIGKDEKTLNIVNLNNRNILFMPGINFPKFTSKEFYPAWHDVLHKKEHNYSNYIPRWSIVFFADRTDMDLVTYEEAHKTY